MRESHILVLIASHLFYHYDLVGYLGLQRVILHLYSYCFRILFVALLLYFSVVKI